MQPSKETSAGTNNRVLAMPTSLREIADKSAPLNALLTSADANSSEEPGAGKLHAGIREGAVGKLAVLPPWLLTREDLRVTLSKH